MGLFSFLTQDIAIDLGTANTIIICNDKIVVNEPSIVAIDRKTEKVIAIGEKARQMQGRTHDNIKTIRPLRDGVIADFNAAEQMLRGMIKMANVNNKFFSPSLRIVVCIPSGSTEVEVRAVRDSSEHAGGRDVYMIYEPMAAALGIGLDVEAPEGNMVVDIGGGTTGTSIIQNGIVIHSDDDATGGMHCTYVIAGNFRIPFEEAEQIKMDKSRELEVLTIVTPVIQKMAVIVKKHIQSYSVDAIVLCGGTACLKGIDQTIEKTINIKTYKPHNPFLVTPMGIAMSCPAYTV